MHPLKPKVPKLEFEDLRIQLARLAELGMKLTTECERPLGTQDPALSLNWPPKRSRSGSRKGSRRRRVLEVERRPIPLPDPGRPWRRVGSPKHGPLECLSSEEELQGHITPLSAQGSDVSTSTPPSRRSRLPARKAREQAIGIDITLIQQAISEMGRMEKVLPLLQECLQQWAQRPGTATPTGMPAPPHCNSSLAQRERRAMSIAKSTSSILSRSGSSWGVALPPRTDRSSSSHEAPAPRSPNFAALALTPDWLAPKSFVR